MGIRVLGNKILIQFVKSSLSTSTGGLVIHDTQENKAVVRYTGKDVDSVSVGDIVYLAKETKFARVVFDGEEFFALKDDNDIMAVLEQE